jgi:transcription initiation factor TFIIIB Brf1 subunit/transcription initiation factor TFIIB
VKTLPLALVCPACGSSDVFYSCTPNCCFNHVCADCRTTFEPATAASGESLAPADIEPPDPLPDASDPTAGCARCDSIAVYRLPDGRLVCAKCGTVLKLEITEVSPG